MKNWFFGYMPTYLKIIVRIIVMILPGIFLFDVYRGFYRFYFGLLDLISNTSEDSFFFFLQLNWEEIIKFIISIAVIPFISIRIRKIFLIIN